MRRAPIGHPAQIDLAHGVDDVGVGSRYQSPGVETFLPDGQHVVPGTEYLVRIALHAQRVDQWQRQR